MASLARAGVTSVTIDGSPYDLVSDVSYSLNTLKRESLPGMDYVHGYAEPITVPYISFTLRDASSLGVASFQSMTSSIVNINLRNGKKIVGYNMWTVDVQEIDVKESTIKVKFEGRNISEA